MKFPLASIIKQAIAMMAAIAFFTSCNKDVQAPEPVAPIYPTATQTVYDILSGPNYTILKAAVDKAGLTATLSDKTTVFTLFAPTDQAFQAAFAALGVPSAVGINAFRPGQLDTIIRYHIVGGVKVSTDAIAKGSPNLQLPSLFTLAPPSASLPPGLRLSVFASKNVGLYWLNNLPMQSTGTDAINGMVYPLGFVALPPSSFLWDRINTDPNMTYFKAAIQRADSGATASTSLVAALQNPAANLTAFVPTNAAMQAVLTAQITQAFVLQGIPLATAQLQAAALASSPTVFSNPLLYPYLTATTVKGLAVYHLLGVRLFTVNMPTTAAAFPTLLNTAVPTHPGVTIKATFGTSGVTAATVKGIMNASASNIQINSSLVKGTSDQHYINGVLHVIDQVLIPQ